MIDLPSIREWGTTILMGVFFLLWQMAQHHERQALAIATSTVETTRQCVASYSTSADRMNQAVDALTLSLRAE